MGFFKKRTNVGLRTCPPKTGMDYSHEKVRTSPTLFIIPKKSLFLPPREWRQNIIEGSCSPKGNFKTFSPFQSLLILKKPYLDLLSNSSKNLKGILIVFPA
jgi:hypothetical protein